MLRIGAHMSTSKGYFRVPIETLEIGGNCFQIFPHSPSMWKAKLPDEKKTKLFAGAMENAGLNAEDALVHSGYLINLASPKEEVRYKSIELLKQEIAITEMLGLKYLNFHPGSHLGTGLESGIDRIARGIDEVLSAVEDTNVVLLLENVAPKGGNIGSTIEELRMIIERTSYENRIGITYDTCHGFDSGYDIRSREMVEKLLEEIDALIGLERLKMIHLNDSKYPLGASKDRHERIGEGYIGEEGFAAFLSKGEILERPLILETPGGNEEHAQDIKRVKKILGIERDVDD
ncbi:endonuclease IV [Kosmotoga arenicorallina S304]|uniref:Probable endonuclease 4 n=1 Tax=Kosmotoga arenicorallina S304 TaxID=1453497 RepID=A0A176K0E0_9BACT|nr:deoxyribonuclease IV [Kosmotoga arenicorallina]OAA30093.1 endonuclease IV [Kosmotoga arenicorallina S304]